MNVERKEAPIRCHNREKADIRFQDGGLPYVVGTKNYQAVRADRSSAEEAYTWTYNHAPMIAYWKGKFWIEYISNPVGEHIPPSRTMVTHSDDGKKWSVPQIIFPPLTVSAKPYCGPGRNLVMESTISCVMHQRMGFFVSSADRLLAVGFYGISPDPEIAPNNGYGIGRVIREIYEDGTFSDIYYIRKNRYSGYEADENLYFPWYQECSDKGFSEACEELLGNRIIRQQWWEEERFDEAFFSLHEGKAISCYTLPDGHVMGVCKNSMAGIADREGKTWDGLKVCPTLETSTGKVWGQRTRDGRYALVYNPSTDSAHRWPLAVVTGENGRDFDSLCSLTPEVSPCRYAGALKNLGPQYVRGINEKNPQPDDSAMWLTYSVNKEDIWVCRVPVPVTDQWPGPVNEVLDEQAEERWNIYCPQNTRITSINGKNGIKSCFRVEDREPYDRAGALRVLEAAGRVKVAAELMVESASGKNELVIELQGDNGRVPIRIRFRKDGEFSVRTGGREETAGSYEMGEWLWLEIEAHCDENRFWVKMTQADKMIQKKFLFSQSVRVINRIFFTTKASLPWNTLEDCGKYGDMGDLPDRECLIDPAIFYLHKLVAYSCEEKI